MKKIIFGTDWWGDCDDVVALRVITRFIKDGRTQLLGIGVNTYMENSVASVRGFLNADGIHGVPIGIDRAATDVRGIGFYHKRLAEDYAPSITNEDAEDGVKLYRRLLAESDGKVVIAEVGFMNIITGVLKSGADEYSPKSGMELVKEKVSRIYVMGGRWNEDGAKEHNFSITDWAARSASEFLEICPVPITLLGFEIGYGVMTGRKLDKQDHLYRVLCDYNCPEGRHSWDPMLALLALLDNEEEAGYSSVEGEASVEADSGKNHFTEMVGGPHRYLKKLHDDSFYEDMIDSYL